MITLLFIYGGLSLVFGAIVATAEIWSPRSRIRADDHGASIAMALVMGLIASMIWPILVVKLIYEARRGLLKTDHCDDYIEDPKAPLPLRNFLRFARGPAHGLLTTKPHPALFADLGKKRIRVTMASRMGDVGITTDLDAETGYQDRVRVSKLKNFSEVP